MGVTNRNDPVMGTFAWNDFFACTFAETTFHVAPSTLHQLSTCYALPESLQRAVLKRQVEFLAGRVCAQQAIERLTGHKPATIPSQPDRAPGWHEGIIGSITHTTGYAAALVASATYYYGIGIDCEGILTADNLKLQRHICVPDELQALHMIYSTWTAELLLTLIFSAKESLFKCLYPQVQTYFGFCAARVIALDGEQHTFVIELTQDLHAALPAHQRWVGYFRRYQSLLMTAILYPKETAAAALPTQH
jgi:enterobactin synthetase component D